MGTVIESSCALLRNNYIVKPDAAYSRWLNVRSKSKQQVAWRLLVRLTLSKVSRSADAPLGFSTKGELDRSSSLYCSYQTVSCVISIYLFDTVLPPSMLPSTLLPFPLPTSVLPTAPLPTAMLPTPVLPAAVPTSMLPDALPTAMLPTASMHPVLHSLLPALRHERRRTRAAERRRRRPALLPTPVPRPSTAPSPQPRIPPAEPSFADLKFALFPKAF